MAQPAECRSVFGGRDLKTAPKMMPQDRGVAEPAKARQFVHVSPIEVFALGSLGGEAGGAGLRLGRHPGRAERRHRADRRARQRGKGRKNRRVHLPSMPMIAVGAPHRLGDPEQKRRADEGAENAGLPAEIAVALVFDIHIGL